MWPIFARAQDVVEIDGWVRWGYNPRGQYGKPLELPAVPHGVHYVQICPGLLSTLALRSDGEIVGSGYNCGAGSGCGSGLLGPNIPENDPDNKFIEVALGYDHALALQADGTVVPWGGNALGQATIPPIVNDIKAVKIGAGEKFSVALLTDGTIVEWGDTQWYGNDGCPDPFIQNKPPGVFVDIEVGGHFAVARRSDGTLAAWGQQTNGPGSSCLAPVITGQPQSSGFTFCAAGHHQGIGLKPDGTVTVWGKNNFLQGSPPPCPACSGGGLPRFLDVAGGYHFNIGIRSNGTLLHWGKSDQAAVDVAVVPASECWYLASGGAVSFHMFAKKGCYVDCDRNGVIDQTVDYNCFLMKYAAGNDPYADCNADGLIDPNDITCFQQKMNYLDCMP
jgi:alpha-tubulin suppressor-like RCC1 family protein